MGMMVAKNIVINANHNISVQEINQIETYITKIYMWKEITREALPSFEDINQADEIWIWEVVKKNLEDYEFSYKQIEEKAIELFGEKLTKKFPKEGTEYLIYDEKTEQYYAVGMGLDQLEDSFLLNKIDKIQNGYEVEIVEYLEDYSKEGSIIIRNTEEQEKGEVNSSEEEQVKELVKNRIQEFKKKKIRLKKENEKLYIEKVYE